MANIFYLTDENFSRYSHIDIDKPISIEDASILLDICLECKDLIFEIFIDVPFAIIDGKILEGKEYFSSIFERYMEFILISEIPYLPDFYIRPLLFKYFYELCYGNEL